MTFEQFARNCQAQRLSALTRPPRAALAAPSPAPGPTPTTLPLPPLADFSPSHSLEFPSLTLCLDPGDTTGVALLRAAESIQEVELPATKLMEWMDSQHAYTPFAHVVAEDYLIYQSHLQQHTWSRVPTLRLLGKIEYWCELHNLPLTLQTAQQAKGFASDAFLKRFDLYHAGNPHARDALRHGVYFLCFGSWQT